MGGSIISGYKCEQHGLNFGEFIPLVVSVAGIHFLLFSDVGDENVSRFVEYHENVWKFGEMCIFWRTYTSGPKCGGSLFYSFLWCER